MPRNKRWHRSETSTAINTYVITEVSSLSLPLMLDVEEDIMHADDRL